MCPQAPGAQSSLPQVADSASALHVAVLSWGQSQGPSPSPLPTQELDPAQPCSCCQSPSSQPDTCCHPPSSPPRPQVLWAGPEGTFTAWGIRPAPQSGPPRASPNTILLLFSHEWRLHPASRAPPPRLLLPANHPGQNHTNKEDWGSAQAPEGFFLLTLPKIFKTTLNWVVIMMPCYT